MKVNREKEALVDQKLVKKLIDFNPETGDAFWLPRTPDMFAGDSLALKRRNCNFWNSLHANTKCGGKAREYLNIRIGKYQYLAHRLLWLWFYGEWPTEEIDHINGNGRDNSIKNLRQVSRKENLRNVAKRRNNTSGVTGVYYRSDIDMWRVNIKFDGEELGGSLYENLADATKKAEEIYASLGVTQRHGKEEKHNDSK